MATAPTAIHPISFPMQWFIVLSVVAVALALGLSPDPHTLTHLHISVLTYRLAVAFLLIPYIIIWFAAFYAFAKLREYTAYVQNAVEGTAFRKLTIGMGALAFGLIIPTMVSLIFGAITQRHPGFETASTIITNYLTLLVPLVAFSYINTAAHLLIGSGRERPRLSGLRLFVILFLVLSTVYTQLVLHDHRVREAAYHLDTFFLIGTYVVPYLYAWFLALFGAFEFRLYARHAKGVLYRRALRQFAGGITVAICGSIIIQFVTSTMATRISDALGSLLLVEYILLIIVAVGLIMMAFGTKKLKRIEEV